MTSLKVAIITGASSGMCLIVLHTGSYTDVRGPILGIGRHSAIKLSSVGWSLALTARRLAELEETKSLCSNPDACIILPGDITDEAFVKGVFEETMKTYGRLDLLFNVSECAPFCSAVAGFGADVATKNAGMSDKASPLEDMPLETFKAVVNVNLVASFLCTREAFKIFKQQTPTGGS